MLAFLFVMNFLFLAMNFGLGVGHLVVGQWEDAALCLLTAPISALGCWWTRDGWRRIWSGGA